MDIDTILIITELDKLNEAYMKEPNLTNHYNKHLIIRGNLCDDLFPSRMTK